MHELAERFRAQARRRNGDRRTRGHRYGAQLRAEALEYAQARSREGASLGQVAGELGVSAQSLRRWATAARQSAGARSLVAVEVVDDVDASARHGSLVLSTATGLRVEGLDLAGLVTVLRALQ